jgi:hypothetical protein
MVTYGSEANSGIANNTSGQFWTASLTCLMIREINGFTKWNFW